MSVAARIRGVCGRRLKMTQAEIDQIANALETTPDAAQDAALRRIIAGKERAAAEHENTVQALRTIANDLDKYANDPDMLYSAALRLLDATAAGGIGAKGNRSVITRASVQQQAEINQRAAIAVINRHIKVLRDKGGGLRVLQRLRGEVGDDALSSAELAAARDIRKMLVDQKAAVNASKGIPAHLDDGIFIPQRVRSSRLAQEAGATDAEKEDNFVKFMLDRIDDEDGFWTHDNSVRLRAYYRIKTGQKDGAIVNDDTGTDVFSRARADGDDPPIEEFWSLDKREFAFKNSAAEMEFFARYTGAQNLSDILGSMAVINARDMAASKNLGGDIATLEALVVNRLNAGGVSTKRVQGWQQTLANYTGELDSLEHATQLGQFLTGAVSSANIVKLDMSVLTLIGGIARTFGHTSRARGVTMGLLRSLDPLIYGLPADLMSSRAYKDALDGMGLANYQQVAEIMANVRVLGGISADNQFGKGTGAEIGAAMQRIARRGVLKWSGFEWVAERLRSGAAITDNLGISRLLDQYDGWGRLPKRFQDFLREGNIGESEYDAAAKAFRSGGKLMLNGRALMNYNAIGDARIVNKWQARSNQLAAEMAGYAPLNLDAKLKWGDAGTISRAGAGAIFGLFRDPAAGSLFLMRHINAHWENNKLEALGFLGAFVAMNMGLMHLRSQVAHTITYGEPHDYIQKRPNEYLARLAAFYGAELFGEYFFNVKWAENHAAAIAGGPAWEDGIAAMHGVTNLIVHGENSGIAKFFADENDARARAMRDFIRNFVPLPGFVKRPLAAAADPNRESSLALLGFGQN